jgi:streptogramin lyase
MTGGPPSRRPRHSGIVGWPGGRLAGAIARVLGFLVLSTCTVAVSPAVGEVGSVSQYCAGITPMSGLQGIAAGPDGDMWFAEYYHRVGRISPAGLATEFSEGLTAESFPSEVAAGPDGNVWFTDEAGLIGRVTPTGEITEFSEGLSPHSDPLGIASGVGGDLWFTEYNSSRVGRISPSGAVTEFSAGIPAHAGLGAVTVGPEGDVWFTESEADEIGRITPEGDVSQFSTGITPGAGLEGITTGPDGNLWFTEAATGQIGRITPAGVVTTFPTDAASWGPTAITVGPDGNLWFAEPAIDALGRISANGVVTQFPAGGEPFSEPLAVAGGPDGGVWYTETDGCIGRIVASVPATPTGPNPGGGNARSHGGGTLSSRSVSSAALVSLAGASTRISRGGLVRITLTCGVGSGVCTGRLTLTTVVHRRAQHFKRWRAHVLLLASGAFSIAPTHTSIVTLRVSAAARRVLARLALTRITASATAASPARKLHATLVLHTEMRRRD